ncbi:MAG: hypothetical protein ABIH42_10910 [Planctomycetota bacterium]
MERSSSISGLLKKVAGRQRTSSIFILSYTLIICFSIVYALVLLTARFFALIPGRFEPVTLLLIPALCLILSFVFYHRPTLKETAQLIDSKTGTKDLFLTAVLIENSAGEYKPLVLQKAQERASAIVPKNVVSYNWGGKAVNSIIMLLILLLGVCFLPQFDPFGKEEKRQQADQRKKILADSKKATAIRMSMLSQQEKAELSKDTKQAISKLKATFNIMKPTEKQNNSKILALNQKELGELWRKKSEDKLKNALSKAQTNQSFGKNNLDKSKEWKEDISKGNMESLNREMKELKELAEKLKQSLDSIEKQKLTETLKQRVEELKNFAEKESG